MRSIREGEFVGVPVPSFYVEERRNWVKKSVKGGKTDRLVNSFRVPLRCPLSDESVRTHR